jgi:hypothetical protein
VQRAVAIDADSKLVSAAEFCQVAQAFNFIGAVAFWRQLERLAKPERQTTIHAMGVLREIAKRAFVDCDGLAFSPQQAECFRYCALTPLGSVFQEQQWIQGIPNEWVVAGLPRTNRAQHQIDASGRKIYSGKPVRG